jgi:DNA-binding PadR family transcriptional regulator
MLELAILGLLEANDLHGYELRKRLTELLGVRLAISFGSLYPALGRLEKAGLVTAVTSQPVPAGPMAPTSGSLVGELAAFRAQRRTAAGGARGARGKKVYGITTAGRQHLVDLLADPDVADDRTFPVRVAFCGNLSPDQRLALFERRRAEVQRRVDQRTGTGGAGGGATGTGAGDRRVNAYLRSLFERDTAALEADLAWLDGLIRDEPEAGGDNATGTETGTRSEISHPEADARRPTRTRDPVRSSPNRRKSNT